MTTAATATTIAIAAVEGVIRETVTVTVTESESVSDLRGGVITAAGVEIETIAIDTMKTLIVTDEAATMIDEIETQTAIAIAIAIETESESEYKTKNVPVLDSRAPSSHLQHHRPLPLRWTRAVLLRLHRPAIQPPHARQRPPQHRALVACTFLRSSSP